MESKVSEWRPGPTVCRCCLSEGCYKDISTEYFWMGKREVYAEMLSETLDLSISYSASGGPNSNSRLICENCIARLRDATDFKRQVQECEKTFIQHIDGGANITDAEVQVESAYSKPVKVEDVKLEKRGSDDDFDDRGDFLGADDDDDDLDDQPLTKIASRTPKKETVDILDLLDNAKAAEKRKSTTKTKTPPAKKLKKKEPLPKPSASKTLSSDKKKKGETTKTFKGLDAQHEDSSVYSIIKRNASIIIDNSTITPFKCHKNKFFCFYCGEKYADPRRIREHTIEQHEEAKTLTLIEKYGKYNLVNVDVAEMSCKRCDESFTSLTDLKNHLINSHGEQINANCDDGVVPFDFGMEDFCCYICRKRHDTFLKLNNHMRTHSLRYVCETCRKGFVSFRRLRQHFGTHATVEFNRIGETTGTVEGMKVERDGPSFNSSIIKKNACTIIENSNVTPFRWHKSGFRCFYCDAKFADPGLIRKHTMEHHKRAKALPLIKNLGKYDLVKIDVADMSCKICQENFTSLTDLKNHVTDVHRQTINKEFSDGVIPFHFDTEVFNCYICKKDFDAFFSLNVHMNVHFHNFVCDTCGKGFISPKRLKQHFGAHMKNKLHCTGTMTKMFKAINVQDEDPFVNMSAIKRNSCIIIENSTVTPFKCFKNVFFCFYCDEKFANPKHVKEHTSVHHEEAEVMTRVEKSGKYNFINIDVGGMSCKICREDFTSLTDLKIHLMNVHEQKINLGCSDGLIPFNFDTENFTCHLCEEQFHVYPLLNHHMNTHFQNYICDTCGKGFVSPNRLKGHLASHATGEFPCSICNMVFTKSLTRSAHLNACHNASKGFKCAYCPEVFNTSSKRNLHQRDLHNKILLKPKCPVCAKTFNTPAMKNIHVKGVHLRKAVYSCDVCGDKFIARRNLSVHKRVVHKEQRIQCDICKKFFAWKHGIIEHMRIHMNDKRYKCDMCDKTFIRLSYKKFHIRRHHPEAACD